MLASGACARSASSIAVARRARTRSRRSSGTASAERSDGSTASCACSARTSDCTDGRAASNSRSSRADSTSSRQPITSSVASSRSSSREGLSESCGIGSILRGWCGPDPDPRETSGATHRVATHRGLRLAGDAPALARAPTRPTLPTLPGPLGATDALHPSGTEGGTAPTAGPYANAAGGVAPFPRDSPRATRDDGRHDPASAPPACSRNRASPRLRALLTVPSGVSSWSAISRRLNPCR